MAGFEIRTRDILNDGMVAIGQARRNGSEIEIEDKSNGKWKMTFDEDVVHLSPEGRGHQPSYRLNFSGSQIAVTTTTHGFAPTSNEETIDLGSPIAREEQERLALDVGGALLGMPLSLLLRP